MSYPVFYVPAGDTLPILFDAFDGGTGASITLTGLAVTDIEIYKDGSVTQRASDAGYTLLDTDGIDIDGITGIHGFSIDTSDNTDAGFYAVGAWYHVVVSSVTIDAQTVNFIAAAFRIMEAEATAGVPDVNVSHISDDATAANNAELMFDGTGYAGGTTKLDVNTATIAANAITATAIADGAIDAATFAAGAINAAAIATGAVDADALAADAAAEIADAVWDEAATGHTDAGKAGEQLWTDIDAILVDTSTTLDDLIDTEIATIISTLGTPAGASVSADIAAVKVDTAATLADTGTDGVVVATASKTGYALSAAGVQAIWDALVTALTAVGSIGKRLVDYITGDTYARLGAPAGASISADIAAIEAQTDDIGVAGAGLTAIPWNAAWDAEVQSEVDDALAAAIADSIPADGSIPSVKQALYMITQFLLERSVSGTTVTVKKADGTTTLLTLTLNDGTSPTSITRTT